MSELSGLPEFYSLGYDKVKRMQRKSFYYLAHSDNKV